MILNITDKSWEMFLIAAQKGAKAKAQWESPKQKKKYKIFDIWPDRVIVKREKGNNSGIAKSDLKQLLNTMNKNNGKLRRAEYTRASVAQLSTMVNFHPNLFWSEDFDWIAASANNIQAAIEYKDFGSPPDDNISELQTFARKIRKGQSKFRNGLMKLYIGKCCITGESIAEILEACHIESHAKNGINNLSNGLLLRSDLHLLFDYRLLFIEPKKHLIHFDTKLKMTDYYKYQGKKINPRLGTHKIDESFLELRWKEKTFK